MLRPGNGWRWSGVVLLFGLALGLSGPAAAASSDLRLSPDVVEIGSFFDGAQVEVKGTIPQGSAAVVEVLGSAATVELLRKGRRGGLWMSVGEINVHNAPSLYLLLSSAADIPALTGAETPWGFAALSKRVKFSGRVEAGEQDKFFQEFLGLKKDEQIYRLLPGVIKVSAPHKEECAIRGGIPLPAKVPPGQYQVRLTVIKEGRVLEQAEANLTVKMVGFPAMLTRLAHQQGTLYGVVAVLIAIATGFLMGILFKGKAEH